MNRWVAVPDPYFAWVGPAVLQGPRDAARASASTSSSASSPRASVHLVAAVLSRARAACPGWPTTATRGRPTSSARTRRARTRRPTRSLEAWALRPRRRRHGGQPADRRRPRRAAPVARGPRARAAQRLRPRRAAGGRLARRRLLDRAHRPAVRPRAAGGRVPRRRSRRSRRTSRRCSSASTRAACGRTPTGSAWATASASSRSCRLPSPSATSARPTRCCWSTGAGPRAMSSKVFEYLQAGRPVFAISPAGSAARGPLRGGRRRHLRAARRPAWPSRWPPSSRRSRAGAAPVADPAALRALRARPPHRTSWPASSTSCCRAGRDGRPGDGGARRTPRRRPPRCGGRIGRMSSHAGPAAARRAGAGPLLRRRRRADRRRRARHRAARGGGDAQAPLPRARPARRRRASWRCVRARPQRASRARTSAAVAHRPARLAAAARPARPVVRAARSHRRPSSSASSWPCVVYARRPATCSLRRDPMPFAAKDLAAAGRALVRLAAARPSCGRPDKAARVRLHRHRGHDGRACCWRRRRPAAPAAASSGSAYSMHLRLRRSSPASPSWRRASASACRPRACSRAVTSQTYAVHQRVREPERPRHATSPSAGRSCSAPSSSRAGCAGSLLDAAVHRSSAPPRSCAPGSRSSLVAAGHLARSPPSCCSGTSAPKLSSRTGKIVDGPRGRRHLVAGRLARSSTTAPATCCASSAWRRCSARRRQNKGSGRHPHQPHRAAACRSPARTLPAGRRARPGRGHHRAPGTDALGITNLHNWWLETYADGGLVGFALHLVFFLLLVFALWPIARARPRPAHALPGQRAPVLALLGWTDRRRSGPSSSVSFAPMWILYGLALAVVSRARLARPGARAPGRAGRRRGTADQDAAQEPAA